MKQAKELYKVYQAYFQEQRRWVRFGMIMMIGLLYIMSALAIRKAVLYETGHNYHITIFWLLSILLIFLRLKHVDMKYREKNQDTMEYIMRYAPFEQDRLRKYCDRKMWITSGGIALGLVATNFTVSLFLLGIYKEIVINISLTQVTYIIILTVLINVGVALGTIGKITIGKVSIKKVSIKRTVVVASIVAVLVFVVLNFPLTYDVDKTVQGLYGTIEEGNLTRVSIQVKGKYRKYLLYPSHFTGVISSEDLGFNTEKGFVDVYFDQLGDGGFVEVEEYKNQGRRKRDILGYLFTDAMFQDVYVILNEEKGVPSENLDWNFSDQKIFVGGVKERHEASRVASYYSQFIMEDR